MVNDRLTVTVSMPTALESRSGIRSLRGGRQVFILGLTQDQPGPISPLPRRPPGRQGLLFDIVDILGRDVQAVVYLCHRCASWFKECQFRTIEMRFEWLGFLGCLVFSARRK